MLDFKKNRKSNLVIVTLLVAMIILLASPMTLLAAGTDTTAPNVERRSKSR